MIKTGEKPSNHLLDFYNEYFSDDETDILSDKVFNKLIEELAIRVGNNNCKKSYKKL